MPTSAAEDLSRYDCVFLCNVRPRHADGGRPVTGVRARRGRDRLHARRSGQAGELQRPFVSGRQGRSAGGIGKPGGRRATRPRNEGYHLRCGRPDPPDRRTFPRESQRGPGAAVTLEYFQVKLAPGSPARVVLRFDSGDPAIIERPVGRGRTVLVDHFGRRFVEHVARPSHVPADHSRNRPLRGRRPLAGATAARRRTAGVDLSARETACSIRRQIARRHRADAAIPSRLRRAEAVFSDTVRRGIYEFILRSPRVPKGPLANSPALPASSGDTKSTDAGGAQKDRRQLFAVNVDTRESDLEAIDEKTLHATTWQAFQTSAATNGRKAREKRPTRRPSSRAGVLAPPGNRGPALD